MNKEDLKPCPICGGPGVFSIERDAWDIPHVWIQCRKCNAYVIGLSFDAATELWNNGIVHRRS